MPDNYIYLGLLAAMFPNAVFIHCRRDLRDVALSCWMTDFRPENIPWASDPTYIGSHFDQYLRLMNHWRFVMPAPIHEVNYEDTVADLEGVANYLLEACGLDYEPGCLDFHRTQRRVKTASVGQVRQPIYSRSVGRWRNYEAELAPLFQALPRDVSHSSVRTNGAAHRQALASQSTAGPLPPIVRPGSIDPSPGGPSERSLPESGKPRGIAACLCETTNGEGDPVRAAIASRRSKIEPCCRSRRAHSVRMR